jgi:NitT/TauT family transport system permease protein/taurine transport system permease protein
MGDGGRASPVVALCHTVDHLSLLMAWLGIVRCRRSCSGFFPAFSHRAQHHRRRARCRATLYPVARSVGATPLQTHARIVFPLALPAIVSGLRVGTGLVVIGVVVTEMLASLGGIGFLISYHRPLFDTGHVYFGMLLALLVAVGVNVALTRLDRRVGSWREQAEV